MTSNQSKTIPDAVNKELDHLVLQELLTHLRDRPQVQNIDIMNTAGFCRNCLAKWRHRAARKLPLSGATYEQACEYVYGMPYDEYKKKHQMKATPAQLELFKSNEAFHASHDGLDLSPVPAASAIPHSSVCCDEFGNEVCMTTPIEVPASVQISSGDFPEHPVMFAVLTISDRAYQGVYADLSGPKIEQTISNFAQFNYRFGERAIVPDEQDRIEATLRDWVTSHDVIITTGGTGLSKRDVTPEATLKVIEKRIPGIAEHLRRESAKNEPMAWLSRGEAGSIGSCLIVNLPGSPAAAEVCTRALLPLILRSVKLLRPE